MQHLIVLGALVRYADGSAPVAGLLINPNTNRLEYLLVPAGASDERAVPIGIIDRLDDQGIALEAGAAPGRLPSPGGPPVEGTLPSNIDDLCLARQGTPVRDRAEQVIGHVRGFGVNEDYRVVEVLLEERESPLAVARVARYSTGDLTVLLPDEVDPYEGTP